MFVVANLLTALAHVLRIGIYTLNVLLLVRVIASWLPADQLYKYRNIIVILNRSTDWMLNPLRRRLPLVQGGFDFTPLLAILVLYFLDLFLVKTLFMLAVRLAT